MRGNRFLRRSTIVLSAIALLATPASSAPTDYSHLLGVWDGTIGNLPVRACFEDQRSTGEPWGVYYYRSRLITIPLMKDGKSENLFSEGWATDKAAPRWNLMRRTATAIEGSWTQESKSLPLRLARVPTREKDAPCASLEFQQPRLAGVRVARSPGDKDSVAYTKLGLDHRGHFGDSVSVETFELAGTGAAISRINDVLKKPLDRNSWLECIRNAYPWGGDHHESFEPRMISRRWLVVNHHWDGFCGGAHPDSSNAPRTFDHISGAEIDVRDWFNDRAIKRTTYEGGSDVSKTIQPAFRKVVIGRWKGEGECADVIETTEWWNVELGRDGFVFTPSLPHVVQACEESFKVPFAKVAPYLTVEGKKQVTAVQAEFANRR